MKAIRIRRDPVFVSSVLFTICVLTLIPRTVQYYFLWFQPFLRSAPNVWVQNLLMPIAFASLANFSIALIVIWKVYVNGARWAWFVMLMIVLLFAFPVYILPLILETHGFENTNWSEFAHDVFLGRVPAPEYAEQLTIFLVMVFSLLLPIKAFFGRMRIGQ
jgi:hypothetical protein